MGGVGLGLGICVMQHLGHTGSDGNARPPTPLSKSLMEHLWALLASHSQIKKKTHTHMQIYIKHMGRCSDTGKRTDKITKNTPIQKNRKKPKQLHTLCPSASPLPSTLLFTLLNYLLAFLSCAGDQAPDICQCVCVCGCRN